MGFMQNLRQNMPAVVIFLTLMFVLLIIFEWGDASRGRGSINADGRSVGSVNGEDIGIVEFQKRVDQIVDAQRTSNPDADVDVDQIRDYVWNLMVDETLINQAADKLGIYVTNDELKEALLYDPPAVLKQSFTDSTGTFMEANYQEFMTDIDGFLASRQVPAEQAAELKQQIYDIQEQIRSQRMRQAVESAIKSIAVISPIAARNAFTTQNTKASGNFVFVDASAISDDQVTVADEELKAYYEKHKSQYQQKASREVRYVNFTITPSSHDSSQVTKRFQLVTDALENATTVEAKDSVFGSMVEQFGASKFNGVGYTPFQELDAALQTRLATAQVGEIFGPIRLSDGSYMMNVMDIKDSGELFVSAQHILIKSNNNEDSAKTIADELAKKARSGENFDNLARENSQDFGSAQKGGDVGYFKKGAMVKPFEDASFAATPGSIVGPVKSEFGYHIIKINDRSSKSFKLRALRFDPRVSNNTKNLISQKANQFRERLQNGGNIDSLASEMSVTVQESGAIPQRMQPIAGSLKLTTFAFNGVEGDVSDVISQKNGDLVVGQLSKVRQAGIRPFDDAKEEIRATVTTQKKLDLLKDKAAKIRASLSPGDSLSKAKLVDATVDIRPFAEITLTSPFPGVGYEYSLATAVFSLKPGELSSPIRGERGYYIVKVDSRVAPAEQDFEQQREQFMQQYGTQKKQSLFQEWLQKERERAEIVDKHN